MTKISSGVLALLVTVVVTSGFATGAHAAASGSTAAVADPALVEHGRYLVRQVGMCADCHGSRLEGATLDFLAPNLPVAHKSMPIAGLRSWTTPQAIAFFETGRTPSGKLARPPMPQYRFHHSDAAAIVAYLKQLR